jgi:uncharacterized protein (TIGR00730 family)
MSLLRTVCVYCGSGAGTKPAFVEAAQAFGRLLAENGIGLVYGGGSVGLMGELATSVLDHGGHVTGIIPEFLMLRERLLHESQEIIVTRDMHERKRTMFDKADAFVALPGGIGTLEELVEQLTWAQLGRHKKPILIANIAGFWDPLCVLIDHMRDMNFIHNEAAINLMVAERVEEILPRLTEAARKVSAAEKEMKVAAERM